MESPQKTTIIREWIVFAISLGLGGHVALGMMLHEPAAWPLQQAGTQGLLVGLSVYILVQLLRSFWWALRGSRRSKIEFDHDSGRFD